MNDPIYTVSQITGAVKRTLEDGYGRVRVRGEISNFRRPTSGHLYFALKDSGAQLRAVMFRGAAVGLRFLPADGLEVEAEGEISVYEPRGDLQLLVRRMTPSGAGALMRALAALRERLAAEGLFDPARKRPLPPMPRVIGIVTSPTGAAVRDLLHVLARRWPAATLVFHPVAVQGEGAGAEIAAALDRMNRWGGADVIIVGRGGGSLEDLWAFNEEPVVRAIAACRTPVISAVGHETDVTLSDLAADVRAATPSAAAEIATPDCREVTARLGVLLAKIRARTASGVRERRRHLDRLAGAYGFRKPEAFLAREAQRVDDLAWRLARAAGSRVAEARERCRRAERVLAGRHPRHRLAAARAGVETHGERLRASIRADMAARGQRLAGVERALRALDPTAVLGRGYALVRDPRTGNLVISARGLAPGAPFVVQFSRDRARARVERVEPGGPLDPVEEGNA